MRPSPAEKAPRSSTTPGGAPVPERGGRLPVLTEAGPRRCSPNIWADDEAATMRRNWSRFDGVYSAATARRRRGPATSGCSPGSRPRQMKTSSGPRDSPPPRSIPRWWSTPKRVRPAGPRSVSARTDPPPAGHRSRSVQSFRGSWPKDERRPESALVRSLPATLGQGGSQRSPAAGKS